MPGGCEEDAAFAVANAIIGMKDCDALFALFYGAEGFACLISDDQFIT